MNPRSRRVVVSLVLIAMIVLVILGAL